MKNKVQLITYVDRFGGGERLVLKPLDNYRGNGVLIQPTREEVAALVSWLSGDECSFSTGTARAAWRGTPLDGGRLRGLHRPR